MFEIKIFIVFFLIIDFINAQDDTPQWRPSFHFTPEKNWINDPNGLFYHNGIYHIFFQYNPYGNQWGSMSWGHAISSDLFHWDELPVAILSQQTEDIFSGSIVIDEKNVTGFATNNNNPPIVAIYTSAYKQDSNHSSGAQAQSIAYSLDTMAENFQFYPNNPVLNLSPEQNDFRDPKAIWYEKGNYWVLATVIADQFTVRFWKSTNLLQWEKLSDFTISHVPHDGAQWECPDLFPLFLDGNNSTLKWVLIVNVNPWGIAGGSGGMYYIGDFDGKIFTAQNVPAAGSDFADFNWLDHGADFYAASSFYNLQNPYEPILIGWMNNWDYAGALPTFPWKGAFSIPRKMSLKTINGAPKLVFNPVQQFSNLIAEGQTFYIRPFGVSSSIKVLEDRTRGILQNIEFTIKPSTAKKAGIIVRGNSDCSLGTKIIFDIEHSTLTVDRSKSGKIDFSNKFSLQHTVKNMTVNSQGLFNIQVIVDRGSIEVFAGDYSSPITDIIFPSIDMNYLAFFAEDGSAAFQNISVTNLPIILS
uniref:Glycosyl hydrolase family 32 N-terminal domain-containing protein n=2 Tax=Panagrolaimus sp. PS1159 TaxID=55785 RepID=A0AC35GRV6_9BILA